MYLTDKQQEYLKDICKDNGININQYLQNYNIILEEMTSEMFNDFVLDNTKATQKQINYLKTLHDDPINYIKSLGIYIDDLNILTRKQITIILNALKKDFNIINTTNINFDLYTYNYSILKKDYLIGKQINKRSNKELKVMSFFNFLVIDWDNVSLEYIKDLLKNDPHTWFIYQTYSGYHGYCMSKTWNHYKQETLMYMQNMSCDPIYISFVKSVGFVIRIQKKENRDEPFIEKFVCQINDYPLLQRLSDLDYIKNNLLSKN